MLNDHDAKLHYSLLNQYLQFNRFIILSNTLASFSPILEWTIDLTDSDKVLRIETSRDITTFLIAELEKLGIRCNVMGTFVNKLQNC